MGAVYFYHLTRSPLETTLAPLIEKALGAGWRVAVRGKDAARLDWLDQKLWQGGDEKFLPHGQSGGSHDADQPVILTTETKAANGAACLIAVDGAPVNAPDAANHKRVCVIFDGNDPVALDCARGQWRDLTEAGCEARYWSQENGKWTMKAETA